MSYDRKPIEATVAELKPRMKNITILFKVIEIGKENEVQSRRDGTTHRVANVIVGDSTGIVRVPLWDDAINTIEVDKTYKLTNGYTGLFRDNLQLNVGRYGKLSDAEEEIEEINTELDMSAEEHEDTRRRRNYRNDNYRDRDDDYDNRKPRYGGRGGGDRGYGGRDRQRR
jgi:replication factor A1